MVDFTTAIIFQYVYFIPQKAKSFAITYFCVACYSINWFHDLRRHFVYKVSAVEIVSCWNIHWIPVIYWNQTRGSILHVIQPKEVGAKTGQSVITVRGEAQNYE